MPIFSMPPDLAPVGSFEAGDGAGAGAGDAPGAGFAAGVGVVPIEKTGVVVVPVAGAGAGALVGTAQLIVIESSIMITRAKKHLFIIITSKFEFKRDYSWTTCLEFSQYATFFHNMQNNFLIYLRFCLIIPYLSIHLKKI
jgi:hypothetical protein